MDITKIIVWTLVFTICIIFWTMLAKIAFGGEPPIPLQELNIIHEVAQEYDLTGEETKLLQVIRIVENGSQGREFGVLTPRAMRYADHPDWRKSFRVQAQWAAGTVKKRYNGDLRAFADRYCPIDAENDPTGLNKHWYRNAKHWMERL